MSLHPTGARARFSVVVPVYKVQGYLRECLDSVLGQSFRDLEVLAVDDSSPDGCGRILDEYAARDPRLRVLHLARNGGLGPARNAGTAQATGDYLLFLDSDDRYLPGALASIDRRLTAAGDPELLVFDHQRSYWWGEVVQSRYGAQLAEAAGGTGGVRERPELLSLFHVAWNKAYRRDFYTGNGLSFEPGLYEDVPVANEAMVCAARVACLPRICVDYRQRHLGAITRSPGRRHFDIFPQYASLFAFLDRHPELDGVRPLLFERMVAHLLFCLRHTDRVRPADRRAYFGRASGFYHRYRPAGFRPPAGDRGFRALAQGHYAPFAAELRARRGASAVRGRLGALQRSGVRQARRGYYALHRRLPLRDDLALYSAYWSRGFACNPAAVHREARRRAPQVHGVWVVSPEGAASLPPGTDHVHPGSRRYWRLLARARYLVNNVNWPDSTVKRPGQLHVMTHHGTPLKRMGLDQLPYPASARGTDFRRLLRRSERWDISVTANPHSSEHWERAYPCAYEDLPAGYPRNDRYVRADADEVAALRTRLGIPEGRTALLYAPTMRDYREEFVPLLDLERFAESLGDEHVLLVRTHYFYGPDQELRELAERGLLLDVSAHPHTEELCLAADGLITDYSSMMFDYANLDRPLVIYAPDWEAYRSARGVYFDLLSGRPGETPGAVARTEEELLALFRTGEWRGPHSDALRNAFRERFCPYDDGRAAERVVRRVFLGEPAENLPAPLPLSVRRPAPLTRPDEPVVAPVRS